MSKSLKRYFLIFTILIVFLLCLGIFVFLRIQGVFGVYMHLIGNKEVQIEIHEAYEEKGVYVTKNFKRMNRNIHIQNNVDNSKIGHYEVVYSFEKASIKRRVVVKDTLPPIITLIGDSIEICFQNENYQDKGINVMDNSKQDLTSRTKITQNIDSSKIGEYKIVYEVRDEANNKSSIERIVKVVENPMNMSLHYHYDKLDNQRIGWWFKKANDHERKTSTYDESLMKKYHAYYIGIDEKVLYLTFDEGGNNITYMKEIVDILNNHDVHASFFLTRNYIASEAELMNQLILHGHEIGNHTRSHYDMTTLANGSDCDRFVNEIMDTHKTIFEVTKVMPPKIFRFPKGDFSERTLAMVSDLGFRSYFWSHAYNDYGENVSKESAYNNLVSHLHSGAIYLLHPANLGNYQAMEDFIIEAKRQGYTFELVSSIE